MDFIFSRQELFTQEPKLTKGTGGGGGAVCAVIGRPVLSSYKTSIARTGLLMAPSNLFHPLVTPGTFTSASLLQLQWPRDYMEN